MQNTKKQALVYKISLDFSREPVMIPLRGSDLKGFNEYRLYDIKKIEDWPEGITFYFKGESVADYWEPRLAWSLVSDKTKSVMEQHQIRGVQFLPVDVIHKTTGESYRYWELNVLINVEALRRRFVQDLDIFKSMRKSGIFFLTT